MPSTSTDRRVLISRRTTLLAVPVAASVAALAGCRWGPEPEDGGVAAGSTPPPVDADRELADRAIAAIATAGSIVRVSVEDRPRLQESLTGFAALHEAHLAHLGAGADASAAGADTGDAAAGDAGAVRARRLAGVLRAERGLQEQLGDLAMSAGSGRLARSLASMAAGVAQHLAVAEGPRA